MTETRSDGVEMEERRRRISDQDDDEIDLTGYFTILRQNAGKIFLLSAALGIMTLFILFLMPDIYKATAIISPVGEDQKNLSSFSSIASTFGIQFGGPSSVEDLEALFRSNDLTVRVFKKYDLWSIVFPGEFDPTAQKLKVGWLSRLKGREEGYRDPTDWDAIRAAGKNLKVVVNKKSGTLSVSFESPSPEGSANIARYYLEEAKSRLQEESLDRARKNKKFIEDQIGRTVDALTRDRLYSLYGQEVEREMMARNREQFGFRVVDAPRVPDRKSRPRRAIVSILATISSVFFWSGFFVLRGDRISGGQRSK